MKFLDCPFGEFQLARWPVRKNDPLQPWDAGDEYLLDHISAQKYADLEQPLRLLIINDSFGALTCALNHCAPVNWSDSTISHLAVKENCLRNGIETRYSTLASTQSLSGEFDLVMVRVPKTNALLEDQLIRLQSHLHADSVVMAVAMVKHLPRSAVQLFEEIIGPVVPSLARKKARLLHVTPDNTIERSKSPYPTEYCDSLVGLPLLNHANVFSRDRLDHGARFLLQNLSQVPAVSSGVDLACGNGVLGIKYQQLNMASAMQFIDESYMAIASTKCNYHRAFPDSTAVFHSADGLRNIDDGSVQLILCNPPFHQQYVVGGQVASAFFRDSKRCLQAHGELWIVANRHLNYYSDLQRIFGNCRVVAANKKFNILRAVKR